MTRWQPTVVLVLFAVPILGFVGVGAYTLWESGRVWSVWWLLPVCWGLAFLLARRWRPRSYELLVPERQKDRFWTTQDHQAWKLVEDRARDASAIEAEKLVDASFYLETAQQLAHELARFYNPRAKDPISSLTVPEILTAAQLALEDLDDLVRHYVPGCEYLTVARWRDLAQVPHWYNIASTVSYAVSALFGPTAAAGRYLLSQMVLSPAVKSLRHNLLLWFYIQFLHRVGEYTIELNSGRLRAGADQWRQLRRQLSETDETREGKAEPEPSPPEPLVVSLALIGQVNVGKSSLVNALLGEQRAAADALPLTDAITRYQLKGRDDIGGGLCVLDTIGYGIADSADATGKTFAALVDADLVMVVLDATNPAISVDVAMLRKADQWFREHPKFRRPPILAVLTHIDGLAPVLEWSPPYDGWTAADPVTAKEKSIRAAVDYNAEQLAHWVEAVVPVCLADGRVYGVEEWLLAEIVALLGEARGVGLVRTLHRHADQNKLRRLFEQLFSSGSTLLQAAIGLGPSTSRPGHKIPR